MISNIFSEYSSMNLEKWEKLKHRYNKQHITEKSNGSMMKLNNESENISRQMKIKTQLCKFLGCSRSSSKRKDYIDTWLV